MSPEERELFERMLKVSEENNFLLRTMEKRNKWMAIWNIVKVVILVIIPFVVYVLLRPYLGGVADLLDMYKDLLNP